MVKNPLSAAGLMSVTFWLVGLMPGQATWQEYAGQEAYNAILGGVASGGIIIASLTAYFAGEFSNSFVLAKMKVATEGRWLWSRTIGSTLIGEGIDTVIFVVVAALLNTYQSFLLFSLCLLKIYFYIPYRIFFWLILL